MAQRAAGRDGNQLGDRGVAVQTTGRNLTHEVDRLGAGVVALQPSAGDGVLDDLSLRRRELIDPCHGTSLPTMSGDIDGAHRSLVSSIADSVRLSSCFSSSGS